MKHSNLCHWPTDPHHLFYVLEINMQPGAMYNPVKLCSDWDNYRAPLTTRSVMVCLDHAEIALRMLSESVLESELSDIYKIRKEVVPKWDRTTQGTIQ